MAHLDALAARFGEAAVLGGQCQISTTLDADGTIRQFGEMQALSLGERSGPADLATRALAAAFAPAGGRLSETILQEMWEKWVFITTLACTTCLMRTTIGDVVAAGASEIPLALAGECVAIATRSGYAPPRGGGGTAARHRGHGRLPAHGVHAARRGAGRPGGSGPTWSATCSAAARTVPPRCCVSPTCT